MGLFGSSLFKNIKQDLAAIGFEPDQRYRERESFFDNTRSWGQQSMADQAFGSAQAAPEMPQQPTHVMESRGTGGAYGGQAAATTSPMAEQAFGQAEGQMDVAPNASPLPTGAELYDRSDPLASADGGFYQGEGGQAVPFGPSAPYQPQSLEGVAGDALGGAATGALSMADLAFENRSRNTAAPGVPRVSPLEPIPALQDVQRAAGKAGEVYGRIRAMTSMTPIGTGNPDVGGAIGRNVAEAVIPTTMAEVGIEASPLGMAGDIQRGVKAALRSEPAQRAAMSMAQRAFRSNSDALGAMGRSVIEATGAPRPVMGAADEVAEAVTEVAPPDPVAKLTGLIQSAKPALRESEALKSAELSKRAGRVGGVLNNPNISPRQRFQVAKGQLRGELPSAQFTPPETSFEAGELDSLFSRILDADLRPFEKLNTSEALTKVLSGQIPQRAELGHLERVFGPEMVDAILKQRPFGTRAWEQVVDALNLPRTLATSMDASAPLRQGVILSVAHPKEAFSSMGAMAKAMASPKAAAAIDEALRKSPYRDVIDQSGLYLAPTTRAAALTGREEAFMSRLAEKLPGVGAVLRASQNGYTTYLNKLRHDVFTGTIANWERAGALTPERAKKLANFVNVATGRGNLGPLNRAGDVLAIPFFAPRLVASRFQTPLALLESDPIVRKMVARDLAAFVGTASSVLGLMHLGGAEVELDPRSTDFARGKWGNTRIDFLGGFQPLIRYSSQIATGERKAESGAIFDADRRDTFIRFLRSKLSPSGGAAADLWTGETFLGKELETSPGFIGGEVASRFLPLFIQDVAEAAAVDGVKGALLTLPAFFGASALTYTTPAKDFIEAFGNATGQDWNTLLDHERIPIMEADPKLKEQFDKWQGSREGVQAQITKQKFDSLAEIEPLATSDPEAYRKQASIISTRAAVERDFAVQQGLIPQGDYAQTPAQAAVDGYFDAVAPASTPTGMDFDLQDKLAANYLETLPPEMRDKVMNELAFSRDPTYRQLLQDRQQLRGYFNAPDTAYGLARKLAGQTPEGSPQRLVSGFETLTEFRETIEATLRKAGTPGSEIDAARGRIEDSVGLTPLIEASRKVAIQQDPAMILLLEKWGYNPSQELRDFAAQLVGGR